jgi:rod shape-determining protein MreD
MIQTIKIILLLLGSVILQTSLIAKVSIFGSKASLPLALTVSVALMKGSFHGEMIGFFSGLLCDLSSGSPFIGIQSLSQVLIGYFTGLMRVRFYSESITTQSLLGFSATLIDKLISLLILTVLLSGFPSPRLQPQGLLLTAIINSLLTIIVFRISTRVLRESS